MRLTGTASGRPLVAYVIARRAEPEHSHRPPAFDWAPMPCANENKRTDYAVAFLRMTAVQMRKLAECAPEIAAELRDLAGDLDQEAIELVTTAPVTATHWIWNR